MPAFFVNSSLILAVLSKKTGTLPKKLNVMVLVFWDTWNK